VIKIFIESEADFPFESVPVNFTLCTPVGKLLIVHVSPFPNCCNLSENQTRELFVKRVESESYPTPSKSIVSTEKKLALLVGDSIFIVGGLLLVVVGGLLFSVGLLLEHFNKSIKQIIINISPSLRTFDDIYEIPPNNILLL
jgi:hypothetical protein